MTEIEWKKLKGRHPGQVMMGGLGIWDIFKSGGWHIGCVAFDAGRPPFVRATPEQEKRLGVWYAPGFVIFPLGLVNVDKNGQRTDLQALL
jgi:hypothetical protein